MNGDTPRELIDRLWEQHEAELLDALAGITEDLLDEIDDLRILRPIRYTDEDPNNYAHGWRSKIIYKRKHIGNLESSVHISSHVNARFDVIAEWRGKFIPEVPHVPEPIAMLTTYRNYVGEIFPGGINNPVRITLALGNLLNPNAWEEFVDEFKDELKRNKSVKDWMPRE